jgi:anaerobic nitric oxide reductase transcription regulator
VRELENAVSRAVLRASAGRDLHGLVTVYVEAFQEAAVVNAPPARPVDLSGVAANRPLNERVARFEREAILDAVRRNNGNWAAAARDLGLQRSNLHHRARRLGLEGH